MSIEQKLQLVFTQSFQVKRVNKQITQIRQAKQKYQYQPRISFVRGQSLTFSIQFLKNGLKKYKRLQNITSFQIKIILKKQYPAKAPLIYCMSDSMIDFGLQAFRDYSQFLTVDWSAKFTILDIIKCFLQFLDGWYKQKQTKKGKYLINQSFEAQKIFSWSFLQTFPIKFIHQTNRISSGLLVINCRNQLILLQQGNSQNTFISRDLIRINQIVSIFRSRQNASQILLQVKLKQTGQKKGLVIRSDDKQNIINCLMEYIKTIGLTQPIQDEQSSQQEDDFQSSKGQLQEMSKQSPIKMNIQQTKEQIVYYESLVQNTMTSQNVSNLVILLKKAIQYYSAIGSELYEIYLKKLKTIMSNQMAQVLLDSAEENNKVANNDNKAPVQGRISYQSIIDMV